MSDTDMFQLPIAYSEPLPLEHEKFANLLNKLFADKEYIKQHKWIPAVEGVALSLPHPGPDDQVERQLGEVKNWFDDTYIEPLNGTTLAQSISYTSNLQLNGMSVVYTIPTAMIQAFEDRYHDYIGDQNRMINTFRHLDQILEEYIKENFQDFAWCSDVTFEDQEYIELFGRKYVKFILAHRFAKLRDIFYKKKTAYLEHNNLWETLTIFEPVIDKHAFVSAVKDKPFDVVTCIGFLDQEKGLLLQKCLLA